MTDILDLSEANVASRPDPLLASSNIVSVKILHKESGSGVADLLVELFDLDQWNDPEAGKPGVGAGEPIDPAVLIANGAVSGLYKFADRIGSAITNASGQCIFEVMPKDFGLRMNTENKAEQKPDLVLLVLAPAEPGLDLNKRLLFSATDVLFNAGTNEAYIIKLSTSLLKEKGIPFGEQKEIRQETTGDRLSRYINEKTREREFNKGVADYHGAQAVAQAQERKLFRKDLFKKIATDFSNVPVRGVFVAEGESIRDKHSEIINQGVIKANATLGDTNAQGVPVNLYLTPTDISDLHLADTTDAYVDIPEADMKDILFRGNSIENPGTLLIHNNPVAAFCATETIDQKCAEVHTGPSHEPPETPPNTVPPVENTIENEDIPTYIAKLVKHMSSPDSVLQPELAGRRADKDDVDKAIAGFSLPKGPAEVSAFYDFNTLQIAFDHVWTQIFDETIPNLAYTANVQGKAQFGIEGIVGRIDNGLLALDTFYAISPLEVPPRVAAFFDITKEEYNEMSAAHREWLNAIGVSINDQHGGSTIASLRMIQSLTEQGERLIDSVRHDDYYSLHKTLRDLHTRLTGKYEFTIFAADKDYHSVNFGLMTTNRETWTPVTYQPGKLVTTISLSPKEERRYSVKRTRQEKRSTKEAKKNNSSVSNEQHSTSRVEADIMAKVQNKTSFNNSAEFDFSVGMYSGKGTQSFGVEAINESSQSRKDFHEAVLKAIQEYKEETSLEVSGEVDIADETSESGTIVNPNDELAVTYLFYELQRRHRVSTRFHRITPVVLVAQEVPSPDRITPAWVICHDWILSRYLLDDSFRPTLQYLINNSVGDDFALREMRKNLRQQRNLVETLRVEFSAASMQADNRYRALEAAISNRIEEQQAEDADGLLNDAVQWLGRGPGIPTVLDPLSWFGGDSRPDVGPGPNPEAAKAREAAAKDAHQYALEKAEKISAALRAEINTLHALTAAYNKTLQARLDHETQVGRLLVHFRNNIFYYMQAIWSMEPPDQRYLRLHNVEVPILELESRSYRVKVTKENEDLFSQFREPGTEKHKAFLHGTLKHNLSGAFDTKPLAEAADLDTLLGFKGNYMIFPMREHNAVTEFMTAPYIDSAFGAMDPDELSNVTLDEYSKYICCLHDKLEPAKFEALKPQLKSWLDKLMASPFRNGEEVVVPTGSLFIEALVDPNPLLEDFKLKHRGLDVFKVQEEVRKAGLENLRLAARLLNAERSDPDIDKKIVIQGLPAMSGINVSDA
jgi:hypothetical protein